MTYTTDDIKETIAWVKAEKLQRKKEEFCKDLCDLIEDEKKDPENSVRTSSGWSQFVSFCMKYGPKE